MDENQLAINTYNKIAEIYAHQYFTDLSDAPYIDRFLAQLPLKAQILDVGCGAGQFTQYMAEKGFQVTGVDFSSEMIATAGKRVPTGKFLLMDMKKLAFPVESFDGLLVAYSLIHIPSVDVLETLQGFSRVLKPGGYLELITQKGQPDQIMVEPFMFGEKMFFNFFNKERLATFLIEAGFEIEYQLETPVIDPDSMSDCVIYTIAKKVQT